MIECRPALRQLSRPAIGVTDISGCERRFCIVNQRRRLAIDDVHSADRVVGGREHHDRCEYGMRAGPVKRGLFNNVPRDRIVVLWESGSRVSHISRVHRVMCS